MKFNGNLIITDPVFIFKEPSDDWWIKTEYCRRMEILGLQDSYMLCEPGYSYLDSLIVYTHSKDPRIELKNIIDSDTISLPEDSEVASDFSTDSGIIGVFSVQDIKDNYNPDIDKIIENNPGKIGTIPGFQGDIEFLDSSKTNSIHVLGVGNFNFYTILK